MFNLSDLSYAVTFLGWLIAHSLHNAQLSPQPKSNKKYQQDNLIWLKQCFIGTLKQTNAESPCFVQSHYLSGVDPLRAPQRPKRPPIQPDLAKLIFFMSKEENSFHKTVRRQVSLIHPPPSSSWGGTSPICHPRCPPQSPKATKNTTEIIRFDLAVFFLGKEGNSPLKTIKC